MQVSRDDAGSFNFNVSYKCVAKKKTEFVFHLEPIFSTGHTLPRSGRSSHENINAIAGTSGESRLTSPASWKVAFLTSM